MIKKDNQQIEHGSRREFKHVSTADFKFDDDNYFISGYATTFDNVDVDGDVIKKGAFEQTLRGRERMVKMRWNHYGPVIGKWTKIVEDDVGLYVEGELTKGHFEAANAYALLKHGAIDGLSNGFYGEKYSKNKHGGRDFQQINLFEISIVEEQANIQASVGTVKSHIENLDGMKQIEAFIRDECRLSHTVTKALISRIKSESGVRDEHEVIDCASLISNLKI